MMKSLFKKSVFVIFAVFITATSCHKKQCKIVNIAPYLKSFFDWKQGWYWIYYDSLNNIRDSVSVLITQSDYQPDCENYLNYQHWSAGLSEIDSTHPSSESWSIELENNYSQLNINYRTYSLTTNVPFDTFLNQAPGDYYYNNLLINYQVGNTTYDSVYRIVFTSLNDTFYVNRKIGLIELLLHDVTNKKRLFLMYSNH